MILCLQSIFCNGFITSDEINVWLNSKGKEFAFLNNAKLKNGQSKITIDTDLSTCLKIPNKCLGIIFRNEGGRRTARLVCSNCNQKKRFLCSRSIVEFTPKILKAKLPCIPSHPRSKRNDGNRTDEKDDIKGGKLISKQQENYQFQFKHYR